MRVHQYPVLLLTMKFMQMSLNIKHLHERVGARAHITVSVDGVSGSAIGQLQVCCASIAHRFIRKFIDKYAISIDEHRLPTRVSQLAHSKRRRMKASAAATAAIWLTALSAAAAAASASGNAETRLPSRTELESVSRRDLINLGRFSIGFTVTNPYYC